MKKSLSLLAVLVTFFAWQQSLLAAAVDVVPAEDVGMSSARLAVLKNRLQQELDNEVTGGTVSTLHSLMIIHSCFQRRAHQ